MDIQLTFAEELAVSSAISLRILDLSETINDCRALGQDFSALVTAFVSLKSAYKKITGVDFDTVCHCKLCKLY